MRFTHPVNTLKKLGCGLAFGAAAIMAMPTSALACTQIYMGSKLTADGNTYYGRSEDFGPRYVKHFGIEPAHKDGNEYTSVESGFEYKSKGATYRYTFVRDNPSQWEDRYDAYSEAGINEKGVSCSATLSTSYNEKAEEADPITEETGIGEYSYASVILGESATAREARAHRQPDRRAGRLLQRSDHHRRQHRDLVVRRAFRPSVDCYEARR